MPIEYVSLPVAEKVFWRVVGKRQYTKQFQQLFPGRLVPETI